ncbi:hypothetical protein ACP275_01G099800 [Erythranthe tilingii]
MAYAAVLSLKLMMIRIFESEKLLSPKGNLWLWCDELPNIVSFLETMKDLPSIKIVDAADCETRVIDAARHFEDLIDSHLSERYLILPSDQSEIYDQTGFFELLSQQLPKVKQEISSFLTAALSKINDKEKQQQQQICRYSSSSSDHASVEKLEDLVGLDDQIKSLKEWVLDHTSTSSVKSVVGMTGIGKTTLVKHVYDDPLVIEKFETRLFLQIGPHYTRLENIIRLVLDQLGAPPSNQVDEKNYYLNRLLWDVLSSHKYLIVLEDVWVNVLGELKLHKNRIKGSHIIVVSQIQSERDFVLDHDFIVLPFLKEDGSWKLLRQTAFSTGEDKRCTQELEKIGKKIARNCEGLPAAILQVGENLRGKSLEEWRILSENEDPLVITRDDNTPLSKALYFSYMMLPQYLKALFLYMGVSSQKNMGFLDPNSPNYGFLRALSIHT